MTDRQTQANEGQEPGIIIPMPERMSLQDYACIHLKVPKTGKPWLDALITESLRNEMAGRALGAGLYDVNDGETQRRAKQCYEIALAMLSTGKGEDENR